MAKRKATCSTAEAIALLACVEHLSGSHLPEKYYDLVNQIRDLGIVEAHMVDMFDSARFKKTVPEGTKFVLLTTGWGFATFTVAIMLTDKGRELLNQFEAGVSA